jgi:hypothetical protein
MARKKWSDLTASQKRVVYVAGAAEAVMTAVALRDLATRPADEVRGSKTMWALAMFVQPFGPIAYLAAARRS